MYRWRGYAFPVPSGVTRWVGRKRRWDTCRRPLATTTRLEPLSVQRLYRYLQLETFTPAEIDAIYDRIRKSSCDDASRNDSTSTEEASSSSSLSREQFHAFLWQRIQQLEQENTDYTTIDDETTHNLRLEYTKRETERLLQVFMPNNPTHTVTRHDFGKIITQKASQVDVQRTWPITASMLLVGSSVGVISPAMPFVVEELSLTASQYGWVVSAFALAKMSGNIPSAIAVERYGRKPFMTYSFYVIAMGVGGIGLAGSFEELYLCRLFTGLGVSFLSTAGTMIITDLSTPLNRASTMAPIMSSFSAGTALGPAMGGVLVDSFGLHSTFYIVGLSYLGVAALNKVIISETQLYAMNFPWQEKNKTAKEPETIWESVQNATGQWLPLLQEPKIRSILYMNGMYWIALAGSQMTLLPLVLTDPHGLAMSATQVGQVYMGMSLVQIFGNPIFAKMIDRVGKAPAIVTGCSLIATSMAALVHCNDTTTLAATLFTWSVGSSMLSTAPVAYISDHVSGSQRTQAIALLRTCGDVGFLLGATGIGTLADVTSSYATALNASSGLLLTGTAWFGTRQLLNHRIREASKRETS